MQSTQKNERNPKIISKIAQKQKTPKNTNKHPPPKKKNAPRRGGSDAPISFPSTGSWRPLRTVLAFSSSWAAGWGTTRPSPSSRWTPAGCLPSPAASLRRYGGRKKYWCIWGPPPGGVFLCCFFSVFMSFLGFGVLLCFFVFFCVFCYFLSYFWIPLVFLRRLY